MAKRLTVLVAITLFVLASQAEGQDRYRTVQPRVIVAVLDTGVQLNHPALANKLWKSREEVFGPGQTFDYNGYNVMASNGLVSDNYGHGTHVAGIIAGASDYTFDSAAAGWVQIFPVKVLGDDGSGWTTDLVTGIRYCIAKAAKTKAHWIINLSLSCFHDCQNVAQAIQEAGQAGILVVISAGNRKRPWPFPAYPAAYPFDNIISVGAAQGNVLAPFSNGGALVAAPGVHVRSTYLNGTYALKTGTSMAAPWVSRLAALLWAEHPDWDFKQVKKRLASKVSKTPGLRYAVISGGIPDVSRILKQP